MSLLADRRKYPPYGLSGGDPGKIGTNVIISGKRRVKLNAKGSRHLEAGDRIRIETPGGGGWGRTNQKE